MNESNTKSSTAPLTFTHIDPLEKKTRLITDNKREPSKTGHVDLNKIISNAGKETQPTKIGSDDAEVREKDMDVDDDEVDDRDESISNHEGGESSNDDSEPGFENLDYWEYLVESSPRDKCLEYILRQIKLYGVADADDLIQDIMEEVQHALSSNRSPEKTVDWIVEKHKHLIMGRVSKCPDQDVVKDDIKDNIWCSFASRLVRPGCRYYSGEICPCIECRRTSILTKVKNIILALTYQKHDNLMIRLRKDAFEREKDMNEDDAIESAIHDYETEIMNRYDAARLELERLGWHAGMRKIMFPWKYSGNCHVNDEDSE